ncbi:heavy-metal-associated domain-containing protein [Aquimarina intermedia]|uniref:Uncharacterized protein n=1 Tax=Aquimarina intermedia TaxID=350814 RepID=A0A5S5C2C1_9FLAO|nr:heavy-metal-associated domain-containing protein [Aquimarina intermedia]TYP73585.1 hypothetical protein BD809_105173 [Aquimarina intermedia]
MSLLSEHVIPGDHGKIFETNAKSRKDLERVQSFICELEAVRDVLINENVFPRQLTVHTSALLKVKDVERQVLKAGFHVVPKAIFPI